MYRSTLTALALLGVASAANITTSLWLFGIGASQQTILGSVIASDATATTYSLACGSNPDDCNLPTPFVYTQGPSTAHYSYVEAQASGLTETVELGCVVTSSASGVCSLTVNIGAETMMSSTTTTSFSSASQLVQAVTITAGASSSAAMVTGSSNANATSASGKSFSGSATGSPIVGVNAGMPMITQAPWVLGAMAAGAAIAAI